MHKTKYYIMTSADWGGYDDMDKFESARQRVIASMKAEVMLSRDV